MRATALALLLALLFPTAAAALTPRAAESCCCTRAGAKFCPMKRKGSKSCEEANARSSCGIATSHPATAIVPLAGDRRPAVLVDAISSDSDSSARPLAARDALLTTRSLAPPEPPPPRRA